MMRWHTSIVRSGLAGSIVLMLSSLVGCGPTFLTKEVYDQAHCIGLPETVKSETCPVTAPISALTPAPATVNQPDRRPRPLTLQEAIAIALENGTASGRGGLAFRNGTGGGFVDDSLVSFNTGAGTLNSQTDRIRVLALNPAIAGTGIEMSQSRFDAIWNTSMNWTGTDNLLQGLSNFNNGHGTQFQSSFIKAFSDGGVANITFLTNYTNLNNPPTGAFGVLNPNYTARISFGFEQPLWRDFGTQINMLSPRLPGITGLSVNSQQALAAFSARQGQISGGLAGVGSEGILIARLRFDQSRAEFERNIQTLLLNAEIAYWNLYNRYGQLYSFEENLRVLQRAAFLSRQKQVAGTEKPINFFQTHGQFQEFRGERVRALQEVLEAERNLRGILGLPAEDGERLIPITPPNLAEATPCWEHCLHDALNSRPEIAIARDNVRYHQYLLTVQKNQLKPDVRAYGRWEPVGFGNTLSGTNTEFIDGTGTPRTVNAFQSLAGGHFTDYQFGLNMTVPLGFRFENAAVRAAKLQLTQAYWVLKDQEDRTTRILQQQFQELARWYQVIEAARNERKGYQDAIKIALALDKAGTEKFGGPQSLEIQRRYAAAFVKEYNAIAEYNNTLARLEWAKGTILRYNNVHISEGPLPQAAQVRAVDEEKKRSEALVICQRPDSLTQPGRLCANREGELFDHPSSVFDDPVVPVVPAPPEHPALAPQSRSTTPKSTPTVAGKPAGEIKTTPFALPKTPRTDVSANTVESLRSVPARVEPAPLNMPQATHPNVELPTGPALLPLSRIEPTPPAVPAKKNDVVEVPVVPARKSDVVEMPVVPARKKDVVEMPFRNAGPQVTPTRGETIGVVPATSAIPAAVPLPPAVAPVDWQPASLPPAARP